MSVAPETQNMRETAMNTIGHYIDGQAQPTATAPSRCSTRAGRAGAPGGDGQAAPPSSRRSPPPKAAFPGWRNAAAQAARILFAGTRRCSTSTPTASSRPSSRSTARSGKTPRASCSAASRWWNHACGAPEFLKGEHSREVGPEIDSGRVSAARRGRRYHPVQLPVDGPDVDVSDGDRLRQLLHPQALREGSRRR